MIQTFAQCLQREFFIHVETPWYPRFCTRGFVWMRNYSRMKNLEKWFHNFSITSAIQMINEQDASDGIRTRDLRMKFETRWNYVLNLIHPTIFSSPFTALNSVPSLWIHLTEQSVSWLVSYTSNSLNSHRLRCSLKSCKFVLIRQFVHKRSNSIWIFVNSIKRFSTCLLCFVRGPQRRSTYQNNADHHQTADANFCYVLKVF